MAFVKYTELNRSHAAKASISTAGTLSFNDGARRRFHIDENRFCVLYYDSENKKVGIELTNDEQAEGAKKIRLRATGADVAVKSFLDYFEISVQSTMLFEIERDPSNNLLVLDLSKGKTRRTSEKVSKQRLDGES